MSDPSSTLSSSSSAVERPSLKEQNEHRFRVWAGYTGFVAVVLVAMLTSDASYPHKTLIISLLAVSLPSLAGRLLLDFVMLRQGRRKSAKRGLAVFLGIAPSFTAITMLVGHFSRIAAVAFVLLTVFWFLVIDRIIYLNPKADSDI